MALLRYHFGSDNGGSASVGVNGRKIPVQPDMLLKADIILEKRSLVEWILEPLLSVRMQG